ncbi:MAG: tetratricopeptide repeat protein [Phycisphaerales bacterium]|nr:MAG: tetratricopeptide repeat protein [Phycisphaerales bacterium]
MKNRRTRLATAAAIAAAVVLSSVVMDWLAPPAWAIGQTVKALKGVRSIVIRGVGYDDGIAAASTLWIRPSQDDGEGFDMRFECEDQLVVVRGKKAWVHLADKNLVMIFDDVTKSYGMMRDLQWWYDLAALNPWITGKVLAAAKHVAEDWEEIYGYDERTGRDCVFVTCAYGAESTFWFVCDLETKLIVEAKYWNWSSPDPEGPPACHATSFVYNEDLHDGIFEFQMPAGVKVIDKAKTRKQEQEARVLSDQAERLFMEGKFAESIDVYQQVYDGFPDLTNGVPASTALCMMGSGYRKLGEPQKAVEVLQKQLTEYGYLEGCESTYYSLGCAYVDMGEKEKALEAFEECLALGTGRREPDEYPLKHAREQIRQIKGQ